MRKILKKIFFVFYKPYGLWLISKDRVYKHGTTTVKVPTGIFHPGIFFSTKLLIMQIAEFNISNKTLLELGSGSGLISIVAAKSGGIVTAIDINPLAVKTTMQNAINNRVNIRVFESNLFSELKNEKFDFIIINPPYFKRNPENDPERAFFAGTHLEYFRNLFLQIRHHMNNDSIVLMSLSEGVDLKGISEIASENNFRMVVRKENVIAFEKNYIFQIAVDN